MNIRIHKRLTVLGTASGLRGLAESGYTKYLNLSRKSIKA